MTTPPAPPATPPPRTGGGVPGDGRPPRGRREGAQGRGDHPSRQSTWPACRRMQITLAAETIDAVARTSRQTMPSRPQPPSQQETGMICVAPPAVFEPAHRAPKASGPVCQCCCSRCCSRPRWSIR